MSFNLNDINDFIYDQLNVVAITGTIPNTRILNNRFDPGTEPTYPAIIYSNWNRFRPYYTLGNGISHYKGTMRVVAWYVDDPRSVNSMAALIETAMKTEPFATVGGMSVMVCRPRMVIYNEDDQRGDGKTYIQAGAIYDIEVAV